MSSNRPTRDEVMMQTARNFAQRGTCLRARVGCVIARDGRILMTGYNGSLPGEPHCLDAGCLMENGHCIRCQHAEINAICWAAREGISLYNSTIYITGWAKGICDKCRMAVTMSGITRIVTDEVK